jgi:hypothetical protein
MGQSARINITTLHEQKEGTFPRQMQKGWKMVKQKQKEFSRCSRRMWRKTPPELFNR